MKKSFSMRDLESKQKTLVDETFISNKREINNDSMAMNKIGKTGCNNRDVIETTASSFEQLCNIISDLEKDITARTPGSDQLQVHETLQRTFRLGRSR